MLSSSYCVNDMTSGRDFGTSDFLFSGFTEGKWSTGGGTFNHWVGAPEYKPGLHHILGLLQDTGHRTVTWLLNISGFYSASKLHPLPGCCDKPGTMGELDYSPRSMHCTFR
jgi:hypothetical protein